MTDLAPACAATDLAPDSVADRATHAESAESPTVTLVTPGVAAAAVNGGALFIDVRSDGFTAKTGGLPQAIRVDRTTVAESFDPASTGVLEGAGNLTRPVVVICGSINGSLPVANEIAALGYTNVVHVDGGFAAWKDGGLPTTPATHPENDPS